MSLPEPVHTFPFDADFGGRTMTLYPSAIETDGGLLLIDTGMPHTVEGILDGVGEAGFDVGDIGMVFLTHQDGDHAGGLSHVLERADPTVIATEIAAAVIDGREEPRVEVGDGRYPPARVDVEVAGGATINTRAGPARVIETPGHTPGHASLYLPEERLLIAGDALGLYEGRLDAPEPEVTMDSEVALESVATLAELDIDRILCYHGGETDAGTSRLQEIVSEH